MDEIFAELEKVNYDQREYMILLMFLEIKDDYARDELYNALKKRVGFVSLKILKLAMLLSISKQDDDIFERTIELKLVDECYRAILTKTKELALELELKNSLEISNLFTYLLWNGYFSKNGLLKFKSSDRVMIGNHYSFDVMNGGGVCLNFSAMLSDFINQFDYCAATIINDFDRKQINDYSPSIKRNIVEDSLWRKMLFKIFPPIMKKGGNHAFNLICEDEKLYIYDATNFQIFDINDKYSCSNICGVGECGIKPYFSYFVNDSEKSKLALAYLNMNTSFESPYTRKDFIFTWENSILYFSEKEKLLRLFHAEISDHIKYINNTVKDIKKLIK